MDNIEKSKNVRKSNMPADIPPKKRKTSAAQTASQTTVPAASTLAAAPAASALAAAPESTAPAATTQTVVPTVSTAAVTMVEEGTESERFKTSESSQNNINKNLKFIDEDESVNLICEVPLIREKVIKVSNNMTAELSVRKNTLDGTLFHAITISKFTRNSFDNERNCFSGKGMENTMGIRVARILLKSLDKLINDYDSQMYNKII